MITKSNEQPEATQAADATTPEMLRQSLHRPRRPPQHRRRQ